MQMTTIPKSELRAFWGRDSLTKPPFGVIICDMFLSHGCRAGFPNPKHGRPAIQSEV